MVEEVDESFKDDVLELLPEAVVWAKPVIEEGLIVDFKILYANKKGNELIGHPKGALKGLKILQDAIGGNENSLKNFESYRQVFETNKILEFSFTSNYSGQTVYTSRRPFRGGVLSTTKDRHDQLIAEKNEQEKTKLLNGIIDNSPAGILVYNSIRDEENKIVDFKFKLSNDVVYALTSYTRQQRESYTIKELLTLHNNEHYFEKYLATVEKGEPFDFEFYYEEKGKWLLYKVVKLDDGFLIMLVDITEKKQSEEAFKRQATFIESILNTSLNGVYSLQAVRNIDGEIIDFKYRFVNKLIGELLGLTPEELVGRSMLELIPENKTNGFYDLFCQVITEGKSLHDETHFKSSRLDNWFEYAAVKMDEETLVVSLQDITERKEASNRIEEQKNLLDNILQYSPVGITVTEVLRDEAGNIIDGRTLLANENSQQFLQLPIDVLLEKNLSENIPGILTSDLFTKALHTLETGVPFHSQYYYAPNNSWIELSVAKMDNDRLINVFTDVTILKNAQLKIEESEERLKAVFNNAQTGMFTFSPVKNEDGEVIDFRFVITNQNFASYVGQSPEVLNGALGSTWFPGYLVDGVFDMYERTYRTGQTERKDMHYNVDGHDIYLDLMSTKMGEEVLVTFTDYTPLKKVQLELEKYVEELKRSNTNLEEFAYAASHDLKEPVRKIHFFSDRLKTRLQGKLDEEDQKLFEKLQYSSKRMGSLIDDLLTYSHISNSNSAFETVDLNKKIALVLDDLELEILQKNAIIRVESLPKIQGYKRQLQQLFQNLIANALKYQKQGDIPEVIIRCNKVSGKETGLTLSHEEQQQRYYLISIKDNGIGFEQEDAERIFNLFTRLHGNAEYKGTGLGLSIARKVMENHKGYIWAESKPGEGATFKLLFRTTD